MKKNYLLLLLLPFISFSQNQLRFEENKTKSEAINLSSNFKNYKIVTLQDDISRIADGSKININFGENTEYTLKENRILSDDYTMSIRGINGIERKKIFETDFDGKYFTNNDISLNKQLILSTFENTYTIFIKNNDTEFFIEPLKNFNITASATDYVFYYTKDAIHQNLSCDVKDTQPTSHKTNNLQNKTILTGGCKVIELAIAIEYNMYSGYYNNVNAAVNRTLTTLNLTQGDYTIANGISDDVQFKVTEHYVVTCDGNCNYWLPTLEIYDNYNNFNDMFVNPYDVRVLWKEFGGTGNTVGISSQTMCTNTSKAVVSHTFGDINFERAILSHELGHNFGCVHSTVGSTIMYATVGYANVWAPDSVITINNKLNAATCISNCSPTVCDNKTVTNPVVTVDTSLNKINVSWLAESGVDFKVRLYNYATNTWSPYTTFVYPTNSTFYTYTQTHCSDNYKVQITPVCGTINGIAEQIVVRAIGTVAAPTLVLSTNVSQPLCSGSTYTFTATSIDGGTAPTYQWKINGINVGINSSTFSSNTLVNNDVLSCDLVSNATCVLNPNATVIAVLNVITSTVLSVSLVASQTTICVGDSVTFTATPVNATGQNISYSWYLNGIYIGSGGVGPGGPNGPTYTTIPVTTGSVYSCRLNDYGVCHSAGTTALSNAFTITIQNPCNLAVDSFSESSLNVYPNPVRSQLFLTSKNTIDTYAMYTVLGQEIIHKKMSLKETTIDVSNLPNGTYFLKLTAEDSSKTIKFIKD
jgi:hypothetical protein